MENSFELTFFNYLAKHLMLWNQVGVAALQNSRFFPSIKPNQWVHFDCFLQWTIVNVLISTRTHFLLFRVCTGLLQIWQNISFIFTPRRKILGYIILLRNIFVAHAIFQIFKHFTFFSTVFFQVSLWRHYRKRGNVLEIIHLWCPNGRGVGGSWNLSHVFTLYCF